jgi:RES domain-containing protein
MSTLEIRGLPVLDLTDPGISEQLGVSEDELVGNNYDVCQAIGKLLAARPDLFGGILAPSAAVKGEQTLVVFAHAVADHVRVLDTHAGTAPLRLLGLFELIIDSLPAAIQRPLRQLARLIGQTDD